MDHVSEKHLLFWRAHERIATKKLCLPLVTSRRRSRRELPDLSWREDG